MGLEPFLLRRPTRGGIVVNWAQADGSVRPGDEKGVIAIIQPATVGR